MAMGGAAVIDAAKAIAAIVYADKDSAKAAGRLLAAASKPRCVSFSFYLFSHDVGVGVGVGAPSFLWLNRFWLVLGRCISWHSIPHLGIL